jgi:hypothetical protein
MTDDRMVDFFVCARCGDERLEIEPETVPLCCVGGRCFAREAPRCGFSTML